MDPLGKSADQIISQTISDKLNGASWHFFQSRSLLDLAKRTQHASPIHFAALELRYGIEYLLFELLVLSVEALDEKTYQKCIGDPHEMKKMLGKHGANYEKLAKFTTVVVSLSNPQFKVYVWDIAALFATWGVSSEFLHFVGIHRQRQENLTWIIESIARLETQLDPIWKAITETHAAGVMTPSRMVPKVRGVWEDFVSGKLSLDDVTLRLKLQFPNAWMSGTQIIGI